MPLNHGFDLFYGIPYSNDMRPESKWDYARDNFPPLPFINGRDTLGVSLDQSNFIEMFTQRSIDFIYENKNNQEILPIYMERDDEFIEKLFKKYRKVYKAFLGDTLPVRPYKSASSQQCMYCNARDFCWADADVGIKI